MNIHTLRNTISHQIDIADSNQKRAESLMRDAERHEQAGDEVQAKLDRESAERYFGDAEAAQQQASVIELEIARRASKAKKLDDEIENHRKAIEKLEREKADLVG